MAPSTDPVWRRGIFPPFKQDFDKLTPKEQWIVEKIIPAMLHQNDPTQHYQNTICKDCLLDDCYLFGVSDDGGGNKGVALQIHLDRQRKILTPISAKQSQDNR